jgi:hypothetical protein
MIEIVSHRGWWLTKPEKNSEVAFRRSFEAGFGTETDIRDYHGKLYISHDVPTGNEMPFDTFLEIFVSYNPQLPLFLNIKSDGIDGLIKEQLERFNVQNYFTFDMSVPEMVKYNKNDVKFLSRLSDIEHKPVLAENASGIWVDQFYNDWQSPEIINAVTTSNHTLCFVSP